jgi:hypothetical protein
MSGVSKSFDSPDELRKPPKASVAVVDLEGRKVARMLLEPGGAGRSRSSRSSVPTPARCNHLGVIVSRRHARGGCRWGRQHGRGRCRVRDPTGATTPGWSATSRWWRSSSTIRRQELRDTVALTHDATSPMWIKE